MTVQPISLRGIRSFHVGGKSVELTGQPRQEFRVSPDSPPRMVDLNGHYVSGQLYAQQFMLEQPQSDVPVLFWHGGAMTGVTWETTPDDRPGWSSIFLRRGYDVVVSDAVERGRSSWSPYPQIYDSAPLFRTAEDAWYLFRMGPSDGFSADPAARRAFAGQQFPLDQFDQLCAQFVPRWTTNAASSVVAYAALVERFDRVVIVAHSQGGWFAQRVAAQMPHRIAAIVLLEPAGAPTLDAAGCAAASRVPHLYVWGDNCEDHPAWQTYKAGAIAQSDRLRALGGVAEHFDLPKMGIRGNSHMPMMDANSDEIADLVTHWLSDQNVTACSEVS
ncbi:alpha/beta fold hydrolase [Puniceibacterium sp. IMCC21224]|uniref:alpha/beta fold hydrolase n=1 Tax=Puniceibacterium sp. IMCC21224 TaxID=1618204 RepID=UPI00065D69C7|nr:alpha/beta fold hydrolase [Puniceibacterium sp. IMCC21224]KMK68269.1 Alpha/beta hydrolase family [Puniceibacterium sp. IMCC21224]